MGFSPRPLDSTGVEVEALALWRNAQAQAIPRHLGNSMAKLATEASADSHRQRFGENDERTHTVRLGRFGRGVLVEASHGGCVVS
jgi:hypothetical protein